MRGIRMELDYLYLRLETSLFTLLLLFVVILGWCVRGFRDHSSACARHALAQRLSFFFSPFEKYVRTSQRSIPANTA